MATLLSKTGLPFEIAQDISQIANRTWLSEQYERWNHEIAESVMGDRHPFARRRFFKPCDVTTCRRVLELCRRLIDGDEDRMDETTRWTLEGWIIDNEPVAQNMWYEERRLLKDIDHIIQLDGKRQWFKAVNMAILDIIIPEPPQTIIVGTDGDGYKTVQRTVYESNSGRCKRVLRLLAQGCDWDEVYQERHDRIEERTRVHVLCWVRHLCRVMNEDRKAGDGYLWGNERPVLARIYEMVRRNDMTFGMFESHALQPSHDKITSKNTYNARRELISDDELTELCGVMYHSYELGD